MTKTEAQTKFTAYIAATKKVANYNRFVNEGGEGYEAEADHSVCNEIAAAGFACLVSTGLVYDAADWEVIRARWNAVAKAWTGKVNVPAMEAKAGVSYATVQALKLQFVK